jgi:copper(I)-binding protein
MVSRRSTGPLRKILPAVAVGLVALGVAGCSSGQVTQTDNLEPAVNGNQANVGDIALRNVVVAYPESGSYEAGGDAPLTLTIVNIGGADDELTSVSSPAAGKVELIGRGSLPGRSGLQVVVPESSPSSSAEPTESSSQPPSSGSGIASGEPAPTGGSGIASGEPAPSGGEGIASGEPAPTEEPSVTPTDVAPEDVGTMNIVLTGLTKDLPIGRNVPITFVFAEAGQITITVPIDSPESGRAEPQELPE